MAVVVASLFSTSAVAPCLSREPTNGFWRGSSLDTPKSESTLYPPGGGWAFRLGRRDS